MPRRRFPVGSVLIAEGDSPREMYIADSGRADVLVADRHGHEHKVGRIVPGTAIGEMSLLTGQPAAGTVRAAEELEVFVLSRAELERVASRFPRIYRNVSAVLAERLPQTNRVNLRDLRGRLTLLDDGGGPPLLGYALGCSVAWHTRSSTLLLVVGEDVPAELSALATLPPDQIAARTAPARKGAHVMIAEPQGPVRAGAAPRDRRRPAHELRLGAGAGARSAQGERLDAHGHAGLRRGRRRTGPRARPGGRGGAPGRAAAVRHSGGRRARPGRTASARTPSSTAASSTRSPSAWPSGWAPSPSSACGSSPRPTSPTERPNRWSPPAGRPRRSR